MSDGLNALLDGLMRIVLWEAMRAAVWAVVFAIAFRTVLKD
jgi:hypothetical protein